METGNKSFQLDSLQIVELHKCYKLSSSFCFLLNKYISKKQPRSWPLNINSITTAIGMLQLYDMSYWHRVTAAVSVPLVCIRYNILTWRPLGSVIHTNIMHALSYFWRVLIQRQDTQTLPFFSVSQIWNEVSTSYLMMIMMKEGYVLAFKAYSYLWFNIHTYTKGLYQGTLNAH